MTNQTAPTIARFLTQGGAVVEISAHRFTTRYLAKGRPYVGDTDYEVNGFKWRCHGCGDDGRNTGSLAGGDNEYLPWEDRRIRDDANEHATHCRSMPQPEETR